MGEPAFNFGDDINSTPISNLQLAPQVTSRNDSGAQPLAPPVYKPTVDIPEQRHVTFQDPLEQTFQDPRNKRSQQSHRSHRSQRSHKRSRREYYDNVPQVPQIPQIPEVNKKKKLFRFMHDYRHQIAIFAIVAALLWYYPRLVQLSYIGNGTSLTMLGLVTLPSASALAYAGAEYVLE
jgi:hypothetical protein